MFEIFILSLVQGITEFLPISSSSHLIIISDLFTFEKKDISIDVSLHIGSFLAVISYFRYELFNFIKNKDLFLKIVVSSIPTMIIGYILIKYNLVDSLRNIQVIGWTTIIFGILLYWSDKFDQNKKIKNNFSIKSAIIIGVFQILSLIPGVSRSGIAITAARILNFNRHDAAKISFLLSIPTLFAVSVYGLKNIISTESLGFSLFNLIAIILSFVTSFITIKYFLIYIKKFSLNVFVFYRILLGIFLLIIGYL